MTGAGEALEETDERSGCLSFLACLVIPIALAGVAIYWFLEHIKPRLLALIVVFPVVTVLMGGTFILLVWVVGRRRWPDEDDDRTLERLERIGNPMHRPPPEALRRRDRRATWTSLIIRVAAAWILYTALILVVVVVGEVRTWIDDRIEYRSLYADGASTAVVETREASDLLCDSGSARRCALVVYEVGDADGAHRSCARVADVPRIVPLPEEVLFVPSDPCGGVPYGLFTFGSLPLLVILLALSAPLLWLYWLTLRWFLSFRVAYYNVQEAGKLPPLFDGTEETRRAGRAAAFWTAIAVLLALLRPG